MSLGGKRTRVGRGEGEGRKHDQEVKLREGEEPEGVEQR